MAPTRLTNMQDIKTILATKKQTLFLRGFDPVTAQGFTQVPNVILENEHLSLGAKLCYALLLRYAWQEERCFPGQQSLATKLGSCRRSVIEFLKELEESGYVEKVRRGMGKTNIYILHCKVKPKRRKAATRRDVQKVHFMK